MKAFSLIARWFFILCLPPLLLSASIGLAFNSLWLYQYGFEKYDASQVTGLADAQLEKAARGLISYFNSSEEFIDITVERNGAPFSLFNEREVIHLKDVKGLVWLDYKILRGTLLYVLIYGGVSLFRRSRRQLARSALIGSGITLFLMAAFGLFALLDFDRLLLLFHNISFSNDFWQLGWGKDYLLVFFPGFEATIFVILATVVMAVILGGVGGGYLVFGKEQRA